MKKIFFAFIAMFSMAVEAQNITDAVRYSTTDLNGTARYRAMSGAFGALGGDLSSLNVNPAGSAVFLSSVASLTLNLQTTENEVGYMNGLTTNSNSNLDLGQAGAAFVFYNNDEGANWTKFALAFNFNKDADFEDDYNAAGVNPNNSIGDYFFNYADGVPLDLLVPVQGETPSELYSYLGETEGFGAQQAFLGYEVFLFDAVDPDDFGNTEYISRVSEGPFEQDYFYAATGLNGRFSFNFATEYKDFLYLGVNLNSHFLNYERVITFRERNNSPANAVNRIYFEDHLNTLGNGFSFQLGGIAKIGNGLRAGLAFQSPTWYNISEETTQYIETDGINGLAEFNPGIINIYPEYTLQTPSEYTGSLAYLFGNKGLISFDYTYKDYSTAKFKPKDDPEFDFQNDLMETQLQGASIFRVGAEYRLSAFSLRGGYRHEGSPYEDIAVMGNLSGYSLGLGYDFGNVSLDFAYDTATQDRNPQLFATGLTDRAYIDKSISNYMLTLTFGI